MPYSELNFIDLSIKLIEVMIQDEPANILHRAMHAALNLERRGDTRAALKIYSSYATDDFAKNRIAALCPEKSNNSVENLPSDWNIRLRNIMTTDEAIVFKAIMQLRLNETLITREALIEATQFSKQKVFRLMENLKGKGYIAKFERHYHRLEIINHPIELDGLMGIPQKPNSFLQDVLPLLSKGFENELRFSLRRPEIISPGASPIELDDNSEFETINETSKQHFRPR